MGTLRLKKGPNLPGPIFPTLHIFWYIFYLINYSLQDPITYAPDFPATTTRDSTRDSIRNYHSRLTFATPLVTTIRNYFFVQFFIFINYSLWDPLYIRPRFFIFRDLISRLTFATPIRDSHSRLPLVTRVRNSHSREAHLRLLFATRIRDHTRDSRSRLLIAPLTATRSFLSQLPLCDFTTDGRTVFTPQHHLPSIPTLTLLKEFGTYSLAWPPPLTTTHHHVHHPQWPCVP